MDVLRWAAFPEGLRMYALIAFLALVAIGYYASHQHGSDSDAIEINTKQTRQDLRLVACLLGAILVMLGFIADKIH